MRPLSHRINNRTEPQSFSPCVPTVILTRSMDRVRERDWCKRDVIMLQQLWLRENVYNTVPIHHRNRTHNLSAPWLDAAAAATDELLAAPRGESSDTKTTIESIDCSRVKRSENCSICTDRIEQIRTLLPLINWSNWKRTYISANEYHPIRPTSLGSQKHWLHTEPIQDMDYFASLASKAPSRLGTESIVRGE